MNKYMEQTFSACDETSAKIKNIIETYDDAVCCRMWFSGGKIDFPLNVELYGLSAKQCKINTNAKLKLALYYIQDGKLYKDKEHYLTTQKQDAEKRANKENGKIFTFASECIIPCGQFVQDGQTQGIGVMIHGKILSAKKAVFDGVKSLHIKLGCQGYVFDIFLDDGVEPFPEAGNILCAICEAFGIVN